MRMRRWADNEVWPCVLKALQSELSIEFDISALSLDSTSVKVHPDGMGPLKKTANKPSVKVAVVGTRSIVFSRAT